MSRMLDLIRASALPSNLMQAAARGALSVPPREMIEILVYLAIHNKVFGEPARLTLAGWDEASSRAVAAEPGTPKEVLDYLISPKNLRPILLPMLLENPSVSEAPLLELAAYGSRETVAAMLQSERVGRSPKIQEALCSNPNLTPVEAKSVRRLGMAEPETPSPAPKEPPPAAPPEPTDVLAVGATSEAAEGTETVLEESILAYLNEHADEIAAEGEQPFQPIGGFYDAFIPSSEEPLTEAQAAKETSPAASAAAAPKRAPAVKKTFLSHDEERGSALQKIAKLDVKGRIQLALKGNKEERSLLIRDGTKIVALAVLESPKVGDGEVERFASQKNVLEAVLRGIPLKRRFAKNYIVVRNLVFNPRTPLDVSLALVKNLLVHDLKNLAANKEVSETVRKLGLRMFKQKADSSKKGKE